MFLPFGTVPLWFIYLHDREPSLMVLEDSYVVFCPIYLWGCPRLDLLSPFVERCSTIPDTPCDVNKVISGKG